MDEFVRLRTSEDKRDYDRSASDHAPEEVWLEVIRVRPDMRFWVAHNRTIPAPIIALLSKDLDPEVRARIASKRNAGVDVLSILARDNDVGVRQEVALNAKTPPDVLRQLASDPDEDVSDIAQGRLRESSR